MNGLLAFLPPSPSGKTGWPWTEETEPGSYSPDIQWPKISIITPSYNQGQFIEETIRSILLQNYPNLEHIVIDGGSSDQTVEVIKKYEPWLTFWVSEKDKGQTHAINKGIQKITGDIYTWINSDDTCLPGALKAAADYLIKHPDTGAIFADSIFTEADGKILSQTRPVPPFDFKNFVANCQNPISQPSSFVRREVIEKTGGLDPFFYYFMDWDFWLRAGLFYKIDHLEEVWSTYRLHADSKTVSQSRTAAPELEYMYKKFFSRNDLPPEIRRIEKKAMMNMYFTSGSYSLTGNDRRFAARMARKAISQYPLGLFSTKSLHKFFYCSFGGASVYKGLKRILGRNK